MPNPVPMRTPVPRRLRVALAGLAAAVAVGACDVGAPAPPPAGPAQTATAVASSDPLVGRLATQVDAARAVTHLQALQQVADAHGGTRASATPGYDASVDYVAGVLRQAGFAVSTPSFTSDSGTAERNVIAQTTTGATGQVVMIGAHLDSVKAGPGIVDDGSGVASLLEIATRLGPAPAVRNAVRFAFFGGEETGSTGSTAYVKGLPAADRSAIRMYLNVDMTASPNGGYFVQGGQGRDTDATGPAGSATVAGVLADRLRQAGVTPQLIPFVGDDEAPFIEAGIPVGGAENGDRHKKTAEQAAMWGGQAGERYDRCYHQACDRIDNVNQDLLAHYLKALAGTVAVFATSTDALR